MKNIISLGVLSDIYNFDVEDFIPLRVDDVTYEVRFNGLRKGYKYEIVNIYELALKCKETMWFNYGYEFYPIRIKNEKNYGKFVVRVLHKHDPSKDRAAFSYFDSKIFETEVEISFKVYQWIIDNKGTIND